ncbi:ATP-binding protein [Candidatus Saccharibacteria bacterium]|nr:ATP-binding protein [Candidatus Saccharibacteria bacterium]
MVMAVENKAELIQALEGAEYEKILDTPESDWVDFKRSQYETLPGKPLVLSQTGRSELSKDVAAFSNADGGILLIGVQEKRSETENIPVAGAITSIKITAIDQKHYKDILSEWMYPLNKSVRFKWYPTEPKKGLFAIIIPKSHDKPHVIRHLMSENGNQIDGFVGIPERVDDQTYWMRPETVYERIRRSSTQTREIFQKTDRAKINETMSKTIAENEKQAKGIREYVIGTQGWDKDPYILLQTIPHSTRARLEGFYSDLAKEFSSTSPIRGMGFNLDSLGARAEKIDGALVKTGSRDAILRLDPNGTLTLVLKISPELAGWAVNKDPGQSGTTINSIVLVEMTYEFTRFIRNYLAKRGLNTWSYFTEGKNLKASEVRLYAGTPSGFDIHDSVVAQKDYSSAKLDGTGTAEKDAYGILVEIYTMFALDENAIPYTINSEISRDSIKLIDARG